MSYLKTNLAIYANLKSQTIPNKNGEELSET